MKEKTPLLHIVHQVVCFQMLDFETSKFYIIIRGLEIKSYPRTILTPSKLRYFNSEGAVSHNVLYYQQLSIYTCNQVSFYADFFFSVIKNYQ